VSEDKYHLSDRVFLIAEAGVNHNGDLTLARQMIDVAVEAGADAVKFQTFVADQVASHAAPKAQYQLKTTGSDESQVEMLHQLELDEAAHTELFELCSQHEVEFISTPFDQKSADLLERLGVNYFKVPSGEVTNLPLLHHIGEKGKPVILSTGMCYLGEVETAIRTLQDGGCPNLTLLHCVSAYPADPIECNLRAIETLQAAFGIPVGFSDHTPGVEIACAAVALGATVIEKHFTLNKSFSGPDHRASLDPPELLSLIKAVRNIEVALGDGIKRPMQSEFDTRSVARRSLVAAQDISAGTKLTKDLITVLRPGTGLSPAMLPYVVGRVTREFIPVGDLLSLEKFV